jgi:tetratricopeptide (TPR) repeat protein
MNYKPVKSTHFHRSTFGTLVKCCTAISLLFLLNVIVLAQASSSSYPGAGSRRNFTLYGDLKISNATREEDKPLIFDVILYTRGGDVFGRQRIGNNGRYRFNNIFNGDYYLAIELDSTEIVRMPILVTNSTTPDIRQDVELQWKATPRNAPGVVSVADSYHRADQNKSLYQKASQEIERKNFDEAIKTLKSLVALDPQDYPAWNSLGMITFIQKDLATAESSYSSALAAKSDYIPALISLGRVRLARKNPEGAIEPLEAALKNDPSSSSANYFLGEAYLALKKGSKAVGYFNEALKLDPVGMADAHLRLGSLYNAANYKDRAASEYEQFLTKKPDYVDRKKLEDYIQANKQAASQPKP